MNYDLPACVEIRGVEYEIRTDYRAVLDIMAAITDPELTDQEKSYVALDIFYPAFAQMPQETYQEAIERCFWFINGGEDEIRKKSPRLINWEQDFPRIVAPINRVLGTDIRGIPYDRKTNTGGFHWWSFLSAYTEIGNCLFAQIISIRNKKAKGKKLDKAEQEFYKENKNIIDIKQTYSQAEEELLNEWLSKPKA